MKSNFYKRLPILSAITFQSPKENGCLLFQIFINFIMTKLLRLVIAITVAVTLQHTAVSQSLSVNTDGSIANASAMLDIKSTTKGLLIPRMNTVQRTGIGSPATGLQVYDTDLNLLYFYNGVSWAALSASTNFWTLSGGNIYNNTGAKVGIGTSSPSAKLHVGAGTRFSVLDTGSIFLQSGNLIGSARDWKIYVPMPLGYLAFRDMGFDNLNNGMATDAMVIQYSTGNVGIGNTTAGEKLEINGNLKFTGTSNIYSGTGTNLTIRPGDGTGSGGALTIRGGNAGSSSGGAGGDLNLVAGANLPQGGSGYTNLGVPGVLNITGSYGYNSVGGNINIVAGATSCWALPGGNHSDVTLKGGQNLVSTDPSSIVLEGGYTIGTSCSSTPGSTGGNLIIKSGLASGTGANGNIQLLNGNVGIGTAAPSSKLEVCGNTRIIGTLNVSSTVTSSSGITCPSDIRYKTNITSLVNPLQKLMLVNGVNYYWKTREFPNMNFNDKPQTGFIAQDLEKIFPEMVFTDDKGYKSIDYSRLTPVLVETIKEQQIQITDITNRLHEIEKMLIK